MGILNMSVWSLLRWGVRLIVVAAIILAVVLFAAVHYPELQTHDPEPYQSGVYLDHGPGWGPAMTDEARQTYYYTPQGAGLKDVRYSWFVNLEIPWGRTRFADPTHLRRYGFIV